jgi:hypothetical protein
MTTASAPSDLPHPSPARDDFHRLIFDMLRATLPPAVTNSPEEAASRDRAMADAIASLNPSNADQLLLTAQYIAATIEALDCLRPARKAPDDEALQRRCSTRSASMLRQARGARSLLFRLHADRTPRHLDLRPRQTAAEVEKAVDAIVARAFAHAPPPEPTAPSPPKPAFDLAAAEQYALANPSKAMLIRSLGRLPKKFDDTPPSPAVMNAVIHGASPILQKLYKKPLHRLVAA